MKRFIVLLLTLAIMALPALAEPELVYRTEDVELHLPAAWAERILILPTPTGAAFYQKASYDKYLEESGIEGGGYLFTLGGCVNNDFEDLPSFIYLGFCEDSAMNYYMELPTDYPAYMDDEIRAEWDSMHNMMRGIAQGIPRLLRILQRHDVDGNCKGTVLYGGCEGLHEEAVGPAVPDGSGLDDGHPKLVEKLRELDFLAEGERLTRQADGLLHGNVADIDHTFHSTTLH